RQEHFVTLVAADEIPGPFVPDERRHVSEFIDAPLEFFIGLIARLEVDAWVVRHRMDLADRNGSNRHKISLREGKNRQSSTWEHEPTSSVLSSRTLPARADAAARELLRVSARRDAPLAIARGSARAGFSGNRNRDGWAERSARDE